MSGPLPRLFRLQSALRHQNGAEEIEHPRQGIRLQDGASFSEHARLPPPDRAARLGLRPAMRKCADLGLIVKVHTATAPTHPDEFYPIIREFPSVNFVLGTSACKRGASMFRAVPDGDG
ncbi:amidohydrolase family protein (plasmid) [Sinorhizobium meliloti]|nr:amidohydrolase family protein [Sinorhizobium meliloti]